MKITSYGAAEEVTGSKHLIEVNGHRVLLDCGMFQGIRKEADFKNRHIPCDPATLDAVVLSHAHIDHSGILPVLSKGGYQGKVYTTPATRELCSIMLLDSANIQQRDAEWLSQKNRSFVPPLYDEDDVHEIMNHIECYPYGQTFEVVPDVKVTFQDAGHVLGAAMICIDYKEDGHVRRLIYTGDLGRKNMPILNDPWVPSDADAIILESTYGDRDHDPIGTSQEKLAEIVKRTHARGGKIIIPSFALERAQEIIYALKNLELDGAIPNIPVYVDSPMTVNITEVFRKHPECFDKEMQQLMKRVGDPFKLNHIEYIRDVMESMKLNARHEPAIIISAAGMCEHGRILHHLKNNCEDSRNTILIVGFQAKNTLGRRIVDRERELKIFGVKYRLNAEVKIMNSFSAHAGRSELIEFGKRFKDCAEKILLVHGEETAITALKSALQTEGANQVSVQREGIPTQI